ncbi:MAG: VTT domain-containing protein [Actinobacteria bacterium]|nr:VTT domain-containing protein [Actinomycetota bacterium]
MLAPVLGALDFLNPEKLIDSFGLLGILLVIFAESGLLVGFFLPGDSLLFTAGLLVSQDVLDVGLPVLLVGCFLAAVAGDQVGYVFGNRVGPALFRRPDSRIFKQRYVEQSHQFFERHGAKTIVLARFVPIVRTFAPILAGVGSMPYRTFVAFNVVGGLMWAVGVTTIGFLLGETIPSIDRYLLPAIGVIVILSVLPAVLEILRQRREAAGLPVEEPVAETPAS